MCRDADIQKVEHIIDKVKISTSTRSTHLIDFHKFFKRIFIFIILMILTAFPVGFFAGLFGIGGGLITVPFLFFIFETLNIDPNLI